MVQAHSRYSKITMLNCNKMNMAQLNIGSKGISNRKEKDLIGSKIMKL